MSDDKQTIFFDGYYSNDVDDNAPQFILGRGSVHIDKLIQFLNDNRKYSVNGYIDFTTKRSHGGKRYTELDLYRFNKSGQTTESPVNPENAHTGRDKFAEVAQGLAHQNRVSVQVLPMDEIPF